MRLLMLLKGDIRFQWKYGFYFIYAVFTLLYVLILLACPASLRQTVATILIFTDPAAMGLFFMGAIVLLEKSQRVNCALSVSPVRVWEYILSKLLSLAAVGLLVGLILALVGGTWNIFTFSAGIVLSSSLFSLCGLIVAMKVTTLNRFVVLAIPFELFICLPPALLLFGIEYPALILHPGMAAIYLMNGNTANPLSCMAVLLVWSAVLFAVCLRVVRRNFLLMGGASI